MSQTPSATEQTEADVAETLDRLASCAAMQSNCMFQLALMVARIAAEPCAETYKAEAAQALMDLIRAKPRSNVVKLFGTPQGTRPAGLSLDHATAAQTAAR